MTHSKGNIHAIETFGTFDGPGTRYVLFMQGCPLKCKFCHNRDSWSTKTNTLMKPADVLEDFKTYEAFYKNGGLTISGGEPLLQLDFVKETFEAFKACGIHTCLDTSAGSYHVRDQEKVTALLHSTDLVLLDVKHARNEAHRDLVGIENTRVYEFLSLLESLGKDVVVRHVLIPSVNDSEEDIALLKQSLVHYACIKKIEVLPYHSSGIYKWEALGQEYPLRGIPDMNHARAKEVERALNEALTTRSKEETKDRIRG